MIAIDEKTTQKKPAKATVVNLGVSFLHLNVTEKTEKPIEAVNYGKRGVGPSGRACCHGSHPCNCCTWYRAPCPTT